MEFEPTILGSLPEPRYLRKRFEKDEPFKITAMGRRWLVEFSKDQINPDAESRIWITLQPLKGGLPVIGIGTDEQMEWWTNTYIRDESGQFPFSHDPINLAEVIKEAKVSTLGNP